MAHLTHYQFDPDIKRWYMLVDTSKSHEKAFRNVKAQSRLHPESAQALNDDLARKGSPWRWVQDPAGP